MMEMLFHNFIYIYTFAALLKSDFARTSAIAEGCDESLVARKGETGYLSSFSASSSYTYFSPSKGRITTKGAWIPKAFNKLNRTNPDYLQVDLRGSKVITAVESCGYLSYYVHKFELWLSHDGKFFFQHQTGSKTEFTSNSSKCAVHYFVRPVRARFVRFVPTGFRTIISLSVDVHGCNSCCPLKGCDESLVTRKGETGYKSSFSATSSYSSFTPFNGRITSRLAWIPKSFNKINRANPDYLQVDLSSSLTITAVETRGYADHYVNRFELWLSHDGKSFIQHKTGNQTEFTSNSSKRTMHYFVLPVRGRYVRFVPTSFHKFISLSVDVHGCNSCCPLKDNFIRTSASSKGCHESLTTKKGKTGLYISSFSASSNSGYYFPSKGRITSTGVWIPEPVSQLNRDKPDYLQVDLGSAKAITAVETRGHVLYYVNKFEIWLSHHGKSFFQYQEGNQTEFPSDSPFRNMHNFTHPVRARYVRFIPTGFFKYIALAVDVYGCDYSCSLGGIHNLTSISVASDKITVFWTTCTNFTQQSISYMPFGGDLLYKTLPNDGALQHTEKIVNLEPCTRYKIIVKMIDKNDTFLQSLNVTTLEGAPGKPSILSHSSPEPFTALIKWKPPDTTGAKCQWSIAGYNVEYRVVYSSRSKRVFVPFPKSEVKVQKLSPWATYEFKVFSVGRVENSTKPATEKVFVNGKAPEQPVQIKSLKSYTLHSFIVTWMDPPLESVHGRIMDYTVIYRENGTSTWNKIVTATRYCIVSGINTGKMYEVSVILNNEGLSKSSEVKEVFVGRRGPIESKDLSDTFSVSSQNPGTLTVNWKISNQLSAERFESLSLKVREPGEQSWKEHTVSGYNRFVLPLAPLRMYECVLMLNTSKSIYYTKAKSALVTASPNDLKNIVNISSIFSHKPGQVHFTVKMPKQYINYKRRWMAIRYMRTKNQNKAKNVPINLKKAEQSFVLVGLDEWQEWSFVVVTRVLFPENSNFAFSSVPRTVLVIGSSPGKPPSDVMAKPLNTTAVKVSWKKIPQEYITDGLREYAVFYSSENATVPDRKSVHRLADTAILTDLQPETAYSIQVVGVNKTGGMGPLSSVVSAKTYKDPRTPLAISAFAVSESEILLKWWQPIEFGQTVANFTVHFAPMSKVGKRYLILNISKDVANEYTEQVNGLIPKTSYFISIFAVKLVNGVFKKSDVTIFNTVETHRASQPPVPILLNVTVLSSTMINVRWKSEVDLKSSWLNFTIVAIDENGSAHKSFLFTSRSDLDSRREREFSIKLGLLQPFHSYTVNVKGVKRIYDDHLMSDKSNEITVRTMEEAPSAPLKFKLKSFKESQVFSWKEPKPSNGQVRSYILSIYDSQGGMIVRNHTIVGKRTFQLPFGLKKYHIYYAKLRAVTIEAGPSADLMFRSLEGRPSTPHVTSGIFNGTHVIIQWNVPKEPNGIISRYKIEFATKMSDGGQERKGDTYFTPGSNRTFILKDTSYGSQLLFKIAGETSAGSGDFTKYQSIFIDPSLKPRPKPPPKPELKKNAVRSSTSVIKLKPLVKVFFFLEISAYQLIVEKLNGGKLQRRAVDSFPSIITNYSTAVKNGDKYYIAAEFTAIKLPKEFVVGDGKTYNGYQNAPLKPGTMYAVHVRVIAVDENGDPVYGAASSLQLQTIAPSKHKARSDGDLPLPFVAGMAGGLLFMIVLVIIIILYLRSRPVRRQKSNERRTSCDMELAKLRLQVDPEEQRPVSLTGDFPLYPDHAPITVTNYNNHVSKMLRNKASGFRCEYNQLEMGKEYSWEIAHLQENKPKNRFANIVAYDHARVILGKIENCVGSDYINASYIDGYMKPNAYVATQGPLPGTFNDFWRMVWELRACVVVMLTNLQEKNKLKCHKYWPDDCIEYGEVIVTQTRKEVYADYIIRTFLLDRTDSPESREVKHFHFTVWPDHGVPKYATALLAFRRRVRSYRIPDSGPTIVHCSAGVGRTGTYIALDATLDRMNINGDVDVFNFVAAMRTRRIAMVQTEEQYIFIHNAILDSVQCGNTEIGAQDIRMVINKLEQLSPETKMSGFEKEWKTLNNVSPIPSKSSCNLAVLPENMPKNRNQNACILPADNSLVRLFPIEDDETTSYINAAYVDGYKKRNAFILTQSPLKNTVCDFWRMLCEHKSASVVLLCSVDEGEDFVKFWPEMHIREYEMITVEYLSKGRGSDEASLRYAARQGETDLVTRQFRVEDSRFPEYPMMVKLFQYNGWNETKVPNTCTYAIQLIQQLERWQQQSGNGPITIICSDGIGRSGTFAAMNAVLERLKVEQVVDVFQAIKAMRIQRAHLVKTLDQYKFIYNAVEEYLDAFDDYANFK